MSRTPQIYANAWLMDPVLIDPRVDHKHPHIMDAKLRNGVYPAKISVNFAIKQKT